MGKAIRESRACVGIGMSPFFFRDVDPSTFAAVTRSVRPAAMVRESCCGSADEVADPEKPFPGPGSGSFARRSLELAVKAVDRRRALRTRGSGRKYARRVSQSRLNAHPSTPIVKRTGKPDLEAAGRAVVRRIASSLHRTRLRAPKSGGHRRGGCGEERAAGAAPLASTPGGNAPKEGGPCTPRHVA
jgi:hypothetical protein